MFRIVICWGFLRLGRVGRKVDALDHDEVLVMLCSGAELERRLSRDLEIIVGDGIGGIAVEDAQRRDRRHSSREAGSNSGESHFVSLTVILIVVDRRAMARCSSEPDVLRIWLKDVGAGEVETGVDAFDVGRDGLMVGASGLGVVGCVMGPWLHSDWRWLGLGTRPSLSAEPSIDKSGRFCDG